MMHIMIKLYFGRYFLNLFGLRGLFSLILGEDNGQYFLTYFANLMYLLHLVSSLHAELDK